MYQLLTRKNIAGALLGSILVQKLQQEKNKVHCCGIVGILSSNNNAKDYLMEGIELLQNRGYDSAGVSLFNNDKHITHKFAQDLVQKLDSIDMLKRKLHCEENIYFSGIGHTRWATCGKKTDFNAHPHFDQNNRIHLIHNGTLENVQELRQELQLKGINFNSDTDSEIIAQFIGLHVSQGMNLLDATKKTLDEKIRGTWGLAIVDKQNPSQMVVSRNGSPIQIGVSNDSLYIASESLAFQKYTEKFITLKDGEMLMLDLKTQNNFLENYKDRIKNIQTIVNVKTVPDFPYRSFFEQEINSQPETVLACMNNGGRLGKIEDTMKLGGLEKHIESIKQIENILIIACGSSFYAGQYVSHLFKQLKCFNTVTCIEASDFTVDYLPSQKCGAIFISQSGETRDIYQVLQIFKSSNIFTMGVVNVVGSLISQNVDCGIYLNSGREIAVPATKSFTSQVIALIMMAVWISYEKQGDRIKELRILVKNQLKTLPIMIGQTMMMIEESCVKVARIIQNESFLMILAKGPTSSICREGALKLKECTYIHAEFFTAGEMKHGPIALIESDQNLKTKVILVILDDEFFQDMLLALSEVKARNAYAIVITNCYDKINKNLVNQVIQIPCAKIITSLLSLFVFQKICNEICIGLQLNPDKPRNLAKTVTV